jgi:hypothetical protein
MTIRRSLVGVTAAVVTATALVAVSGAPASAAPRRNGICENGEICFYYQWNRQGSVSDFTTSIPNYGTTQPTCYEFKGPGDGRGECIKNNARSAWNRMTLGVLVYYNSNYGGDYDVLGGGDYGDFSDVIADNNASHNESGRGLPVPQPPRRGHLDQDL